MVGETALSDVAPMGTFFSIVRRPFTLTSSDANFISELYISISLIEKAETLFVDNVSLMESLYEFWLHDYLGLFF